MFYISCQLTFPTAHLQRCLSTLGRSVMERERSSVLLYSQFYEQILQQENQLLYRREQVSYSTVLQQFSP